MFERGPRPSQGWRSTEDGAVWGFGDASAGSGAPRDRRPLRAAWALVVADQASGGGKKRLSQQPIWGKVPGKQTINRGETLAFLQFLRAADAPKVRYTTSSGYAVKNVKNAKGVRC